MDLSDLPKSSKLAKITGDKFYFTGKPCARGHLPKRLTSVRTCTECNSDLYKNNKDQFIEKSKVRYIKLKAENPEHNAERYEISKDSQKRYRKKNKDIRNAQKKEWDIKNKIRRLAYAKDYNSKLDLEKKRKQARKSYRRNKATFIANVATRRVAKLNRTPPWLSDIDKEIIKNFYRTAARLSKETDTKHHVDHIVPLCGANVSGLHVPWNLQVLTEHENLSKGNKFLVGMV